VTAAQVRDVVPGLIEAGQHQHGDPDIRVVFDAGYEVTGLACLLADLPWSRWGGCARTGAVLPRPAARPRRRQARPARPRVHASKDTSRAAGPPRPGWAAPAAAW
jgi:hypothetical protein